MLPLHCRGGGGGQNDPPPVFFQISLQHMKHFQQVFHGEGLKIGVIWKKINIFTFLALISYNAEKL